MVINLTLDFSKLAPISQVSTKGKPIRVTLDISPALEPMRAAVVQSVQIVLPTMNVLDPRKPAIYRVNRYAAPFVATLLSFVPNLP
jgi:hypothetical protein